MRPNRLFSALLIVAAGLFFVPCGGLGCALVHSHDDASAVETVRSVTEMHSGDLAFESDIKSDEDHGPGAIEACSERSVEERPSHC